MSLPETYPIQEFLDYLQFQKRFSEHTIISYRTDLRAFFDYVATEYNIVAIQEVTPPIIRSWLSKLKSEKAASKTINRKISTLKSFFKYHLRLGHILMNPVSGISSLKVSRRLPVFIEEKDMEVLFRDRGFTTNWSERVAQLILLLLYQTGIRLSELINLEENQVDKSSSVIKVLGKGNKERLIPVSNQLLSAIDDYLVEKRKLFTGTSNRYLLVNKKGNQLYPRYVYNVVKENLSKVSTVQRKSPHVMRHSFATHLTNHGAQINAIKDLLGHSSLAATQIYTHNSIEKLKEVHKQAHPKS